MISFVTSNIKYIWLIIVAIIMIISKIGAGLDYLSVKEIVINHMRCFKSKDGSKWLILPILNYTVVPILLGIVAASFKVIDSDIINIITIIVSILTAMLFTMLTTIIDMKAKINNDNTYYRSEYLISKRAIIETYYAIMYEIVISILLLICCLFIVYIGKYKIVFSYVIYSLSFIMLFNLFMIIKRIFKIIDTDINK